MKSRIDKTEYKFEKYRGGSMFWYKNDDYHRENDLPAIIYNTGTMAWYINGKFIKAN